MLKTTNTTIKTLDMFLIHTERRREDEMRSGAKINHRGGVYSSIFPTELSTKNIIIIFWAVALNSVGNIRRYLIETRAKISKIPPYFSISVGKSIGNCVPEHTSIGFATSVGKFWQACASVCVPSSVNTSVYTSVIMACLSVYTSVIILTSVRFGLCAIRRVHPSVIVAKCRIFFPTLCEIPTGICLSVYPSVIVTKYRNCFSTLCEIPTGICPSVKLAIFLQVLVVLRVYPPAQKLALQTYSTHIIITRADNYKINISCCKISCLILHYKNKALQHI